MTRRRRREGAPAATCALVREAISAALDREEPPLPEESVAGHLASCAACRSYAEGVATLERQLDGIAERPRPVAAVGAPFGRERRASPSAGAIGRWAAALVLLCLSCGALGSGLFRSASARPTRPITACTACVSEARIVIGGASRLAPEDHPSGP